MIVMSTSRNYLIMENGSCVVVHRALAKFHRILAHCIVLNNLVVSSSITDSNHYGIAGYYSQMATRNGLVGMSMTNTSPLMMPTRAKKV